jgi:hypothetical protein
MRCPASAAARKTVQAQNASAQQVNAAIFWCSPIVRILIRTQIFLAGIGKRFYGSQLSLVIV